jgi:Zn-dependent metalloprotease
MQDAWKGTAFCLVGVLALGSGASSLAIAAPPPVVAVAPRTLAAQNAAVVVASQPAFLHASPNDRFVQGNVVSFSGTHYVPYERTYAGLPVVGGDFVLVADSAGQIVFNSTALQRPIGNLSVAPVLTRAAAEAIAIRQLQAVTKSEGTQLVVSALGATPRLAWESTIDGQGAHGVSRLTVDVDAVTGAVLRQYEHVMHGTGTAAWNGPNPVTLNTTQSGSTFTMRDPAIANLSCQDAANNTIFSGPDDAWGNGNATSRETGCVDALFGAQTEARMLSQWLGRNAMDGAGGAWPIRVGLNDLNAFYDGTQVQIGHNAAGGWIGSIDIIAHEMGHGIDDHTPGGISGNGTQEFIADVFGASTEWFASEPAPFDVPDFTVGEQINLQGAGPIRNMYNPSALGDPSCYSSAIPTTEVHAAAGPGNHWFYLLAEGTNPTNGQPTSPTCNGSTVVGIGVQSAVKILYGAMLMKTTASSYPSYRTWTLQAAKNAFPGSCEAFRAVKAAWDAVSVPAQSGDPTCPDFGISVPSATLAAGGRTAVTVSTTGIDGGASSITLSVSGLPPGVTGSFSPATVTAGGSSTLTLVASTSAASGSSSFTVTGTAGALSHAATASVTVSGAWLTGDVNGDGKTDLLQLFDPGTGRLAMRVYQSTGTGYVATFSSNNLGQGSTALAWLTGDVNGDGKTDIIQLFDNGGRLGVIVYTSDGTGYSSTFGTANIGQGSTALAWLTGDVNGDGKTDIIQPFDNGGRLGLIVYTSNGTGYSSTFSTLNIGQGSGALAWLTGDVNGDGRTDILQAFDNGGRLGLIAYTSDGTGYSSTFGTVNIGQGSGALAWLTGDANGDGQTDILQPFANGSRLGLIVYTSNGTGYTSTFESADIGPL